MQHGLHSPLVPNSPPRRYWWVNQNRTYRQGIGGKKRARLAAALVLFSAASFIPADSRGQGTPKPGVQRSIGKYRLGDSTAMDDSENGVPYSGRADKLSDSYSAAWYGVYEKSIFKIYGLLKNDSGKLKFDDLVKSTEKKFRRPARRRASDADCETAFVLAYRTVPPRKHKCAGAAIWEDANTKLTLTAVSQLIAGDDMVPDEWKPIFGVVLIDKKLASALAEAQGPAAAKAKADAQSAAPPEPEPETEKDSGGL